MEHKLMKHKYMKYKSKYLKLKSLQTGGGMKHININMSPYIDFFKKCIDELDFEISFTLAIDENNNIISEFYKGVDMFPEDIQLDDDVSLFKNSYTFAYIAGHTHDHYSKERLGYNYSIPSVRDYEMIIEQYYRFHVKIHYIFTVDGVYKITLHDFFKDIIKQCFPDMIFTHFVISRRYNGYQKSESYNLFIDIFTRILNHLHIILEKPNMVGEDKYDDYIKMIRIGNMDKLEQIEILPEPAKNFLTKILTSDYIDNNKDLPNYIDTINSFGFDLELLLWEDYSIDMMIDMNIYNFVHSSIEARKNKTLVDLLYINEEIEEMYKDINMDNYNNNFITLNDTDLDNLFETIKEAPFGDMIKLTI